MRLATLPSVDAGLDEALAAMDAIHPGTYARFSWNKLRHLLSKVLAGHPMLYFDDVPSRPMTRGREVRVGHPLAGLAGKGSAKLISTVEELGPLSIEQCMSFGRCHVPNSPVFYGSFNEGTVLSELRPALESVVYMLTCVPKAGVTFKSSVVGEIDFIRRHGKGSIFSATNAYVQETKDWMSRVSTEADYVRLVTDAFASDLFLQSGRTEDNFKATSALTSLILQFEGVENPGVAEALYYPSVAFNGGLNIALTRKCFIEKTEPVSCKAVLVQRNYGYGIYKTHTLAESEAIDDGVIHWRAS